jgi:succinate dehydrogenase hydrophobic anchor subunit
LLLTVRIVVLQLSDKKNTWEKISKTYVGFIDVLFAVVLGQTFVLLAAPEYYSTWFASPFQNAFGLATLILVYALVITSWVGYHQSVENYPLKSVGRFLIDIVLLFLYYFAFANAKNFGAVLIAIALSFFAYMLWDSVRLYENRENLNKDLWKRLLVSIIFAALYLIITVLYGYAIGNIAAGIEWLFLGVSVTFLVAYRILKWYKVPIHKKAPQKQQPAIATK